MRLVFWSRLNWSLSGRGSFRFYRLIVYHELFSTMKYCAIFRISFFVYRNDQIQTCSVTCTSLNMESRLPKVMGSKKTNILIHSKAEQHTLHITLTPWWARWRLKLPTSRLFAQPYVQALIKENTKAPRHWPLWGESIGDRWIPPPPKKCQ